MGYFLEGEGPWLRVLILQFVSPTWGLFFQIRSTPADMEGLYQLPKHSERLALVQGGPWQAWLHGLRARRQFEESGCRDELPYVTLLSDAGLLKASVGQGRHLAQRAEPCVRECAGVHGQANGNEPIRHGCNTSRREGFSADFREPAAWDLDREGKPGHEGCTQTVRELLFVGLKWTVLICPC